MQPPDVQECFTKCMTANSLHSYGLQWFDWEITVITITTVNFNWGTDVDYRDLDISLSLASWPKFSNHFECRLCV